MASKERDPLFDPLREELSKQAVRYACSRAIFCPTCKVVLDCDDAVLITTPKGAGISCGTCFDGLLVKLNTTVEQLVAQGAEIDDGRPPKPAADEHGNRVAREGCDRCACGCKYWENDRCVDCGAEVSQAPDPNQGSLL